MVPNQQHGLVLGRDPELAEAGQQQTQQFGIPGHPVCGPLPQQLHAALQPFIESGSGLPVDGAEHGAGTPEAQGARTWPEAGASGPGDGGRHFRPQAQRFCGRQPHHLPIVDAAPGFQGFQPFHRRRGHLGIAPQPIDGRQLITQPAVGFHLPWIQIPGASRRLQGHRSRAIRKG